MGRFRFVVVASFGVAASLLLSASAVAVSDPPAEGLTCSFDDISKTLTVTVGMGVDSGGKVERLGDEIKVLVDDAFATRTRKGKLRWHREVSYETCAGGTPTVNNTDAITVVMDTDEDTDFNISLEGGPLSPGATAEADGTSEIEISVQHLGPGLSVGFLGGPEADGFRFGSRSGIPGVNLNAQDEPDSPDIDATLSSDPPPDPSFNNPDWPDLSVHTGAGDDFVTSAGGPEFDSSFTGAVLANGGDGNDSIIATSHRFTFIKGAGGNDSIQAAGNRNVVFGGGGDDRIVTGLHGDDVEPGKGHDVAFLNGGIDLVAARDRTRDQIFCGKDRDYISRDRKDKTPGCERKTFKPFHLTPFDH